MEYLARGEIERTSERVFFVLPWRHDYLLAPLGHPRRPDLGQHMDSECIRTDEHLMGLPMRALLAHPGQALAPLRIIIFGPQLGSFPHLPQCMEPAPHRAC